MDNASKALIMAGGILIAVLVISVSMYVITSARGVAKISNERVEENAVQSFNRFYAAYTSDGSEVEIMGIDAVNIYRKALDDSKRIDGALHTIDIEASDIPSSITSVSAAIDNNDDSNNGEGSKNFLKPYYFSYTTDVDGYVLTIKITESNGN